VVNFYLLELVESPDGRGKERSLLQFLLRYLVTTRADDPQEAHRMLGNLAFAALENQAFEVEIQPPPAAVWAALGAVPQPAFVLRVPVRKERPQPEKHYVTVPLKVNMSPVTNLRGVVLTSRDTPVAGAVLEIPSIQRSVKTDHLGRFFFPTIPAGSQPMNVKIRAKGRERIISLEQPAPGQEPFVIRFDPIDLPE
jgi:hypothetical protein